MYSLVSGIIHELVDRTILKASILIVGVDGAGKTTLLEKMMRIVDPKRRGKTIRPTFGLNTEEIKDGKVHLRIWDIGGKKDFRSIWQNYMSDANAVVYVINGKQEDRIQETRKLYDEIACTFSRPISLVFLNAESSILNLIPASDKAAKVFFVDMEKDEDVMDVYKWMKSLAHRT